MALFRTVQLLIDRGAGVTIPRDAFEFEVPILEALHGSLSTGLVREVEGSEGTLEVADDSPESLWATMQARYSGKSGEEALTAAYRNVRDFAKAVEASRVKPAKEPKAGKPAKEDDAGPQD